MTYPKETRSNREAAARKEISKRQQLRDESKLDCSSGSESSRDVYYAGPSMKKVIPAVVSRRSQRFISMPLNEVLELKRLFEGCQHVLDGQDLENTAWRWCVSSTHLTHFEKKGSSKNSIKKEPVLDSVRVRVIPIDIPERTITKVLMDGDYTVPIITIEYDYRMEAMKGMRKLSTEYKVLHFQ
ncbi:hypothetical protein HAX54_053134 [Datura stramonium]|uniref:Uncharacterized protein n=1 Tax=Datura stramonium TaxID=4076 RepID=A0ABS8SZW9_DATST|nr:hypothetical protein [Datura stramonium]